MNKEEFVKQKVSVEDFFAAAFCADKATVLLGEESKFKVAAVIKIERSDGRGDFYIGNLVEKIPRKTDDN